MERERYDGADVAHLLHACALRIDWQRLLRRFEPHWRVLLSHLVLFGFIYPGERSLIPRWLMDALTERLRAETEAPPPQTVECGGTLLSREQYLPDVAHHGYDDPRLSPRSTMTPADVAQWTTAIHTPPEAALPNAPPEAALANAPPEAALPNAEVPAGPDAASPAPARTAGKPRSRSRRA
jgi:hypothetical protein